MKRFIERSFISFLLTVCLAYIGLGQASCSLEVSADSILLGNSFSIRFKMENVDGEFTPPTFEKMEIVSGPNVSSSFSSINGEVTKSKTYSYILMPKEEGQFPIFPVHVKNGDEDLYTEAHTIFVYPNPDNVRQQNDFEDQNNFFFSVPFDMPALPKPKQKKQRHPKLKRI